MGGGPKHLEYAGAGVFTLAPAGAPRRWVTSEHTVEKYFWIDRGMVAEIGDILGLTTVELREDRMAMLDPELTRLLFAWRACVEDDATASDLGRSSVELLIGYRLVSLYGVRAPSRQGARRREFGNAEKRRLGLYIE